MAPHRTDLRGNALERPWPRRRSNNNFNRCLRMQFGIAAQSGERQEQIAMPDHIKERSAMDTLLANCLLPDPQR